VLCEYVAQKRTGPCAPLRCSQKSGILIYIIPHENKNSQKLSVEKQEREAHTVDRCIESLGNTYHPTAAGLQQHQQYVVDDLPAMPQHIGR
jgi:hypothetical protein